MIACTELTTGYDDFGKVIFLQSHCRPALDEEAIVLSADDRRCEGCAARGGIGECELSCGKARRGVEKLIALFVDKQSRRTAPLSR